MTRYKSRRAGYKQRRRKINPYWNLISGSTQRRANFVRKQIEPLKYRDNMTADQALALLKQCQDLERFYADAGAFDSALNDEEGQEYFDRYIAGDR